MNSTIKKRIQDLRQWMAQANVEAFIIPSTDPHLSEYVAPHWQSREWISGFTGSAGTVVVTKQEAGLWTDSRYFLQAAQQLEGTCIDLYKEMLPDTPSIAGFLCQRLNAGDTVGIDGSVFSMQEARRLEKELAGKQISLQPLPDPMDTIWSDRPALPQAPAYIYETKYAGRTCTEKLANIRTEMKKLGANGLLLSALDEIAWTLNLRGSDVHCNPVIVSYLLITLEDAHYFIEPQKLTTEVSDYLNENRIVCHPYGEICTYLSQLKDTDLLLTPDKTNYAVYTAASRSCHITEAPSPVAPLKAIRNEQEIQGLRAAMLRDGIALVKFLQWLEKAVPQGGQTEMSVTRKLHDLRAGQALFMGDSFDTIAGYGPHAAIVHYEATPETDAPLEPHGFLLLDSGAQYLDGTTDITRTIALGPLTEEEKTDYTLILKGHIDLAMAVFPEGTRGAQLDVLARMPIWRRHMNFLHGTGHGVGHFLNVHEGPQSIRMNENPVALRPGMITSNEPGVYKAGSHGIRTENLVLTVPAGEGMFGSYLRFETVTLCPICTKGIIREMLTQEEINWLNDYHQAVYEQLAPALNEDERRWLEQACQKI